MEALSYANFLASIHSEHGENSLPIESMHKALNDFNYSKLESLILIHLDHLDGIESSIEIDTTKTKYPSGVALVRDTSKAKPLETRLAPDDAIILGDNLLLRALGTLRGINQVLNHKYKTEKQDIYVQACAKLKELYRNLLATIIENNNNDIAQRCGDKELKKIHEKFNTTLCKILHESNLDVGVQEAKQYGKLLSYYRDLAATLDPAKCLVTTRQETIGDTQKTFTEISYPVTKKTAEQKNQLAVMFFKSNDEKSEANENVKNFHTSKSKPIQTINNAFAELLQDDDRRLPAQSRYTIGPSVKNAYLVHNQIKIDRAGTVTESNNWSSRSGTVAYIGGDETEFNLVRFAKENLLQLIQAAKSLVPDKTKFHFTMLLTDLSRSKQDQMIEITKKAIRSLSTEQSNIYYSHTPANILGVPFNMTLDPIVVESAKNLDLTTPDSARDIMGGTKARFTKVGETINIIANTPDVINNTACASGQDRTGTAQEIASVLWEMQESLKDMERQILPLLALPILLENSLIEMSTEKAEGLKKEREEVLSLLLHHKIAIKTEVTKLSNDQITAIKNDLEKSTIYELENKYADLKSEMSLVSEKQVQMRRALGCHNAILATLATPGSTGMKNDSRPGDYFPDIINKYFYRKTAKTNKTLSINETDIQNAYFAHVEKGDLENVFSASKEAILATKDPQKILTALINWSEVALRYQYGKEGKSLLGQVSDSFAKTYRHGIFGSEAALEAQQMRDLATTMVETLRDYKIKQKPEDILQSTLSMKSWAAATIELYTDKEKRGTVFNHLAELIDQAAQQLEPSSPSPQH